MPDQGYPGFLQPGQGNGDFNSRDFEIVQKLTEISTVKLVQVKAVHGDGITTRLTVDVTPMVTQVDPNGTTYPHGTIYGIPVFVLQGGVTAFVSVPVVKDIGAMICCDRDISRVKNTLKISLPGSSRLLDWSDGLYLCGFLNPMPTQYIVGKDDGLHIVSSTKIFLAAPTVEVDGDLQVTGAVTGGIGTGDQVGLQTHKHPTAATGAPSSPTPGT